MDRTSPHFRFKHPLFREKKTDKGIWWEQSYYFLWYRCLVRHKGYRTYCETGRGKTKYGKLHADFGDIFSDDDFKEWWNFKTDEYDGFNRGAYLFAEPRLVRPHIVNVDETFVESDEVLYLALPARGTEKYLLDEARKLIKRKHKQIEARPKGSSRAKYALRTPLQSTDTYRALLDIRDLREEGNLKNTEIFNLVYPSNTDADYFKRWAERRTTHGNVDKMDRLEWMEARRHRTTNKSSTVKRNYALAKSLIENAAKGVFPFTENQRKV